MTTQHLAARRQLESGQLRAAGARGLVVATGVLGSIATGWLVARGLWFLAAAVLLAVPMFVTLHRRPTVALAIWLAITPLVTVTESGAIRRIFWLVHRALPVVVLIMLIVSVLIGLRERFTVRLGWPEVLAVGYLVATVLSLLYTGVDVGLSATHIYDRIFIPIVLYILVRLLEPDEGALRKLVPLVIFVLLLEILVGVLTWTSPGVLPDAWLNRAGERTSGTLRETNLYGVTVFTAGVFLLHAAMSDSWSAMQKRVLVWCTGAGFAMAAFTFSRAVWLAAAVTMIGLVSLYPRFVRRFVVVTAFVLLIAIPSGMLQSQIDLAQNRFRSESSEESALSRLPVMAASVRMFEARPAFGFGYENFDRFDIIFQRRVGNLYIPEKDHASHNVFLTILAEQGAVGIVLFLGPFGYWLAQSVRFRDRLPDHGLLGRQLVWILWLLVLAQVIVYNFSRLQVAFGFGLLWLMLGLVGSVLTLSIRKHETLSVSGAESHASARSHRS